MAFPLLYEINTRCWLNELSDQTGRSITLANVPDAEFTRWRRLGFTHIWLMGVWTTGPRSRAVSLANEGLPQERASGMLSGERMSTIGGSPYAIAEYRVPEPLGGETGLQAFRRALRERGMKLILDFVPNHVGLDHRWVKEQPEFFAQSPAAAPGTFRQETGVGSRWLAHGRDPNFPPWTDTVQLDYRNPAVPSAMQGLLSAVADRCDGVRCDMAMLVLSDVFARTWDRLPFPGDPADGSEFWPAAISATKQTRPDFLFLAEAYWGMEQRLQSLGFDYTYDKELYDKLLRRNAAGVQQHLLEAPPQFIARGAHFLENHDEARVASVLSPAEHRAAALLILSLPGMRLLHDGQLAGAAIKAPVQWERRPAESPREDVARMYEQMLGALQKTAVGRGTVGIVKPREAWAGNSTAQNVVILQWQAEPPEFDVVVINLAPHRGQCCAPLRLEKRADHHWLMKDLLGGEEHRRSGDELCHQGLYLDLPAHGAQLFHCTPERPNAGG
jgi:hypothetical protein